MAVAGMVFNYDAGFGTGRKGVKLTYRARFSPLLMSWQWRRPEPLYGTPPAGTDSAAESV